MTCRFEVLGFTILRSRYKIISVTETIPRTNQNRAILGPCRSAAFSGGAIRPFKLKLTQYPKHRSVGGNAIDTDLEGVAIENFFEYFARTGVNAPVTKLPTESVTRIVKAYVFGTRPCPFRHVTPGLPSETAPHQQRKPFVQLRSRSSRAGAINLGVGIFGLIAPRDIERQAGKFPVRKPGLRFPASACGTWRAVVYTRPRFSTFSDDPSRRIGRPELVC